MDENSSKRKNRKRGRSLIFKSFFPQTTSADEGKILASDDNLVYCDVSNNGVNGDSYSKTKPSPSRGRMSSIFKAVLFDTAMKKKKKMRSKKASKPATNSSFIPDDKTDNSLDKNEQNNVNDLDAKDNVANDSSNVDSSSTETNTLPTASLAVDSNSPNKFSNVVPPSGKNDASPVASSSVNASSQTLIERKVVSPVKSTDKKPPLPSGSQSPIKPIHERVCNKPANLNNSTTRLWLFIVVVVFVSVILWMSYKSIVTKSSEVDSEQLYTNVVIGDEL